MKEIFGTYQDGMRHAETHFHTTASDGIMTGEDVVEFALRHPFEIHTVVITDHNTISEAAKAKELALQKGYPLEVVVGEEVDTKEGKKPQGHLLALYIESPIPRGLTAIETIRLIHRAGGLVVVPHPFLPGIVSSLSEQTVFTIMESPDPEISIDGFEVFNFGVKPEVNQKAQRFFFEHMQKLGAPTAGTDGHFHAVGGGITAFPENTLREAIQNKTTVALAVESSERRMLLQSAIQFFGYEKVINPQSRVHASWLERRRRQGPR